METRHAESAGTGTGRRWWDRPDEGEREGEEAETAPPTRAGRLLAGTETGVRRTAQAAALLLWTPLGFVFWLPLLLRRTVGYVLAVLRSGLTGRDPEPARLAWKRAVDFYRVGFQRIVRAFGDDEQVRDVAAANRRTGRADGSLTAEALWSALVWAVLLWLTGVWPDAPATVAGGVQAGLDATAELLRQAVRALP